MYRFSAVNMWLVIYIFIIILKTFIYLFLSLVLLIIGCRLYFQPVKEVCRCKTKLDGKVALVTGGNSGIGLEIARDLARRGARVIIASRDVAKSAEAVRDIIQSTGNNDVEHRQLDLIKFTNIRKFAEEFNKTEQRLDILVNNAGIAGVKNKITEDGFDIIAQINFIGPVLLTRLLQEKLEKSMPSRIVVVNSILHRLGKVDLNDIPMKHVASHYARYSRSKLYSLLWTRALSRRLVGVTVNSAHPGFVKTNIFQRSKYLTKFLSLRATKWFYKTAEEGAQTCIHLCVAPQLDSETGGYYSECKIQELPKEAKNKNLVEKLWDETFKLINGF
ncbi:retinol dehydrogenase 12-like [Pieris napi]|uniref:retinol dehydrogenase 12-like n=1 Tax=Pieris napi TaxID=78633 RepID=UPI001FBBBE75|nr:retinol dehydrogenase 12-like [Pieris napi]